MKDKIIFLLFLFLILVQLLRFFRQNTIDNGIDNIRKQFKHLDCKELDSGISHLSMNTRLTPKWVAFLTILLLVLIPPGGASAHPVDMYTQSQSVTIAENGLQVDLKITPGPLLADGAWNDADTDHNSMVSQQEANMWGDALFSRWNASLDDQPLNQKPLEEIDWPTNLDAFRSGQDSIHVKLTISWSGGLIGKHKLEMHNAYLEASSLNWFALTSKDGLSFDEPQQQNGLLTTFIYFSGAAGATPALTSWDSGQPNLSDFSGTLSQLAINLTTSGQTPPAVNGPVTPASALVGLVKTEQFSPWFFVGAFLLSLALGSLHALTPGHGKTLVAAYLIGSKGRVRDAAFLGLVVTLTHTGSVLLLGMITLFASHYILPALIAPWLEVISGLLVIGFGINLFFQRRKEIANWLTARRNKKPVGKAYSLGKGKSISLQSASVVQSHSHPLKSAHAHDEHSHEDGFHHHNGHSHSHALPSGQVTFKSLLTLGISGGLVPCPDAIAILLVAVALNRIVLGMLLIVAFSIGLAFVLIGIGIAMVQGVRLIERNDFLNRFSVYTPIVSAVVVTGLGIGLTLSAVNSFSLVSNTAANPLFDIQQAKLVYLATDADQLNQLFVTPLNGGKANQYTEETFGVASYSISPDQKTILYTVLTTSGASSFWTLDRDGAHRRLTLDCPHAQCVNPVWYPDGQKLVYERLNISKGPAAAGAFSLWWLDLKTSQTRPVFQDESFPSIAAGFSPDGQWMSYISPLKNSLQLFQLRGNQNISIPLTQGYIQRIADAWDATGSSILFWGPASQNQRAPAHVKKYTLAASKSVDISASDSWSEFEAEWSPDGQWIAIVRDAPAPQIWLVRADGTEGHILVDGERISYSDLRWSPDSRFLVYCRYSTQTGGIPEIWQAEIATGQQIKVGAGVLPTLLQ